MASNGIQTHGIVLSEDAHRGLEEMGKALHYLCSLVKVGN